MMASGCRSRKSSRPTTPTCTCGMRRRSRPTRVSPHQGQATFSPAGFDPSSTHLYYVDERRRRIRAPAPLRPRGRTTGRRREGRLGHRRQRVLALRAVSRHDREQGRAAGNPDVRDGDQSAGSDAGQCRMAASATIELRAKRKEGGAVRQRRSLAEQSLRARSRDQEADAGSPSRSARISTRRIWSTRRSFASRPATA